MMKICVAVLISFVALVGAQQSPATHTCKCGAYITLDNVEYEIFILHVPTFDALSCYDTKECKQSCDAEWKRMTDDGDLKHELANGYTVGEELCTGLKHGHGILFCNKKPVYVYSNTCDGPWIWNGVTSAEELCCHDGRYTDC
ncbi:unnamed protein product [Meganyctiphanes norvegica]|uniref:Uncharacterized protein n=1 Tax=Meganyctiphanes norvegica TaxID=48144 RepID=A0AAV2QWD6_MEGNR